MNEWIEVGGSFRARWFLALVALAVCLLAAGAMLWAAQHPAGPFVFGAGLACAVASALGAASLAANRRRVHVTPDGLAVRDRYGQRAFSDEQVICASLRTQTIYSAGEPKSLTRTFDVWAEGEAGAERVHMVNRLPIGAADPLEELIDRTHEHLYRRATDLLAAHHAFDGEGWTLHPQELVTTSGGQAECVRFDELAAVGVFDGEFCIWRSGHDEPAARIPLHNANTHVLARLLVERVPPAKEAGAELADDRLGRMLFERRPGRLLRTIVWLAPVVVILVIIACMGAMLWPMLGQPALGGLVVFCAVIGFLWLLALTQYTSLRCYEFGICRRGVWREARLRYRDVATFAYAAVKQYVKGVYSGTTVTLTFTARDAVVPRKLAYSRTLMNGDPELENVRQQVSRVIAARMADAFDAGAAVPWTDGLRFLPEGIEYRASGILGRKAPLVIGFDQIGTFDIEQGIFRLWVVGNRKPIMKVNMSQANFFPGMLLLSEILAGKATSGGRYALQGQVETRVGERLQ